MKREIKLAFVMENEETGDRFTRVVTVDYLLNRSNVLSNKYRLLYYRQFTGFRDIYDREIIEFDRVKVKTEAGYFVAVVKFRDGAFVLEPEEEKDGRAFYMSFLPSENYEIIGMASMESEDDS